MTVYDFCGNVAGNYNYNYKKKISNRALYAAARFAPPRRAVCGKGTLITL